MRVCPPRSRATCADPDTLDILVLHKRETDEVKRNEWIMVSLYSRPRSNQTQNIYVHAMLPRAVCGPY